MVLEVQVQHLVAALDLDCDGSLWQTIYSCFEPEQGEWPSVVPTVTFKDAPRGLRTSLQTLPFKTHISPGGLNL